MHAGQRAQRSTAYFFIFDVWISRILERSDISVCCSNRRLPREVNLLYAAVLVRKADLDLHFQSSRAQQSIVN